MTAANPSTGFRPQSKPATPPPGGVVGELRSDAVEHRALGLNMRLPPQLRLPVPLAAVGKAALKGTPLDEITADLGRFVNDPLGFVMWAFPWGEKNTPLENETGPEDWQREQLERIGRRLRASGPTGCVIEEDVASGHGVGKSCLVSWIVLWAISTHENTRGVVTANTDTQLRTKTWAELAKWYGLFIAKSLFSLTATGITVANDPERQKAWRIDQVPWSKEKTESFAGLHNKGSRVIVIFDEASAIDDSIWEVTEGALTDSDTQILWLRYGNPTKTTGRFFKNCSEAGWLSDVGKPLERNREKGRNVFTRVDSRTVRFSNKAQLQAWIDEYGEDSDFVRVRVRGLFPRAGFANFISPELVNNARRRRLEPMLYRPYPKVLSIDPARFGDDFSVITLRQGLRVYWQVELSGFDGVDLSSRVVDIVRTQGKLDGASVEPGAISCIVYDAIGNGADLDSALRRLPGLPPCIPVQWGQPAKDDKQYFNQRSECWGKMRDFLEHGQIPDNDKLADQLTSLDYGYDARLRIQLQSKKDAKKNGKASPDRADSLALSFVADLIDRKMVLAKARPIVRRTVVWTR